MFKASWLLITGLVVSTILHAETTLILDDRLDLLVLDGKKVAPSLIRGAGSLKLDNGLHQLVLRADAGTLATSAPLVEIITVNTQHLPNLRFTLNADPLTSRSHIVLLDDKGIKIPVTRDSLPPQASQNHCLEQAMLHYNRGSGIAARRVFNTGLYSLPCPTL